MEKKLFSSASKNDLKTYENVWKIATDQGNDYTTDRLLDYKCIKNYYKMTAIDSSKQQGSDTHPKATQIINFTWKSRSRWKYNNVFHYWRSKGNRFRFFRGNRQSIVILFYFIIISV